MLNSSCYTHPSDRQNSFVGICLAVPVLATSYFSRLQRHFFYRCRPIKKHTPLPTQEYLGYHPMKWSAGLYRERGHVSWSNYQTILLTFVTFG